MKQIIGGALSLSVFLSSVLPWYKPCDYTSVILATLFIIHTHVAVCVIITVLYAIFNSINILKEFLNMHYKANGYNL
jgi:hypothetical protein